MKLPLFRLADGVLLAVVLAAAGVWLGVTRFGGDVGSAVVVETPSGSTTYSLDKPASFSVTGKDGIVLNVSIENGQVQVTHSTCPDKICVNGGKLSRGGQSTVCVPAGITVRVVGGNDAVDGVTA